MPTIYVLSGPDLGKTFSVRAGDTVGRSPDRILTLRHPSVSRKHAHLEEQDGVWYVVDDGSHNGVVFQGERTERAALFDAAEFTLGEILLRFRLEAEAVPASSAATPVDEPVEEEIFLEGEGDEPVSTLARTVVAPTPEPVPERRTDERRDRIAERRGRADRRQPDPNEGVAGRRVLQYHKLEGDGGLAGSELSQFPGWVRALLVILALALAGGIAYLAFRGTSFVKEQVSSAPVQASPVQASPVPTHSGSQPPCFRASSSAAA